MKAYGIGLIMLLAAFAIGVYSAYINYKWTVRLFSTTPLTEDEKKQWSNETTLISLIGLIANIAGALGILIFLVEFIKHEHPHEHEVSMPRVAPPPL